jgi:subtilisin family serine protease
LGDPHCRFVVRPHHETDAGAIASDHGASVLRRLGDDGYWLLRIESSDGDGVLNALSSDRRVAEAAPDGIVTIPEIRGDQLAFAFDVGPDPMGYTNQYAFEQVNLGWSHLLARGRGVCVAVLDTGVNTNHPDLVGHCVPGYDAIEPGAPPTDAPGTPGADVSIFGVADAGAGHGTMIAGIIAIIAPRAHIMPVRVLAADGTGSEADVIEGIHWAVRNGADVINMSFGSPSSSPAVEAAIKAARRAGVVLVASAGNEGNDLPHCPASLKGVLSVASVEADNTKAVYSSYGPSVALVSPGTGIRSTYWNGGYATWSGTSFSAAFVSGAAALLCEEIRHHRNVKVGKVLAKTATSVDDVNPDFAGLLGAGLLNTEKAVRRTDD